jgi:hypothetical protein
MAGPGGTSAWPEHDSVKYSRTTKMTAITYATDEIAASLKVLTHLPCMVAIDANPAARSRQYLFRASTDSL